MPRRLTLMLIAATTLALSAGLLAAPVEAWKPYTHNRTAETALLDARDGTVTVLGEDYELNERVARALRNKPRHYRAGVVGPDAFPDLIMGQSVIHPLGEESGGGRYQSTTGAWLTHVMDSAWAIQDSRRYSRGEKQEILAFAYGYLTHAAGDLWAHTFVNEYAEGVFPALSEAATDTEAAAIVLRHIVVEGYLGDATEGFDSNPDRQPVDGGVSDDSTPAVGYAAPPDEWIWATFLKRPKKTSGPYAGQKFQNAPWRGQPTPERGAMVDYFYDLHNTLIHIAVDRDGGMPWSAGRVRRTMAGCAVAVVCPWRRIMDQAQRRYSLEWARDIEDGLQHWSGVGEAFSLGLFDPGVRRQAQDDLCPGRTYGAESALSRADCEAAVSSLDTMIWYLQEHKYLTTQGPRLGSMLGAPDRLLRAWDRLQRVMSWLEDRLSRLLPQPLREMIAHVKRFFKQMIYNALEGVLGFDVEVYLDALHRPGTYLSNGYARDLPPPLDHFNDVELFEPGTIDEINTLMGVDAPLTPDGRLPDDAELDPEAFAAYRNTVTLSKLVLLPGDKLDSVLTDILHRPINTYGGKAADHRNVMTWSLNGFDPWLLSIDSDHAWRQDGQPVFCTTEIPGSCDQATEAVARSAALDGGAGTMPIWESCVLRPAFRELFSDWQRKGAFEPFPDYGDQVSRDRVNDPAPPEASLTQVSGTSSGGWISPDSSFRVDAVDVGAPRVFPTEELRVSHRIDEEAWSTGPPGETFSLAGRTGRVAVDYAAADPCWEAVLKGATHAEFDVDGTPPVQRCPTTIKLDSDDVIALDWQVTDDGSGIASATATVADFRVPGGTSTFSRGDPLSAYDLGFGYHALTLRAEDEVGNTATTSECGVYVSATSASLRSTIDQGVARGDIAGVAAPELRSLLDQAVAAHAQGDTQGERSALEQFTGALQQHAAAIAADVADRLRDHAQAVIAGLG